MGTGCGQGQADRDVKRQYICPIIKYNCFFAHLEDMSLFKNMYYLRLLVCGPVMKFLFYCCLFVYKGLSMFLGKRIIA
jgi:hypothetical protein